MPRTGFLTRAAVAVCAAGWSIAVLFAVCGHVPPVHAQAGPSPDTVEFYTTKVVPVLQNNCYRCHGGLNHRGGLQMDTREGLLKGGKDGVVLVSGHPDQSLLIKLIRHEGPKDDPMPMPPRGKLSDADIATVTAWVAAGAKMP
jgi:cytochrome c